MNDISKTYIKNNKVIETDGNNLRGIIDLKNSNINIYDTYSNDIIETHLLSIGYRSCT